MNEKLIKAVKDQLGYEEGDFYFEDVYNNGAGGGYPGFCYYSDTVAFYKKNRKAIVELVKEYAEDFFDETPINMVMGFNCLKGFATEEEVAIALYGRSSDIGKDDNSVPNALAWFALEEVARYIMELEDA
jgi:hypothetical protein